MSIKISIIVSTYNQEKYILEALESILNQSITFEYEVLVGEDNSTDNTRLLLNNNEYRFPSNFHFFYRNANLGMINNAFDLIHKAKGEYIAFLEGDDYWIDSNKIDKQVRWLDENRDYVGAGHKAFVENNCGKRRKWYIGECRGTEYSSADFIDGKLCGQTSTLVIRNIFAEENSYDNFFLEGYPGDRAMAFFLLTRGRLFCMDERMSVYRHITDNQISYSATHSDNSEYLNKQIKFFKILSDVVEPSNRKLFIDINKEYLSLLWRDSIRKRKVCEDLSFRDEKKKIHGIYIYIRILEKIVTYPTNKIKGVIWNYVY